jgi:hypothetical protein
VTLIMYHVIAFHSDELPSCLVQCPRSGDDLFEVNFVEHYDAADRFENNENKRHLSPRKSAHALREILDLLQVRFRQPEWALRQRWLRRQVSSIHSRTS